MKLVYASSGESIERLVKNLKLNDVLKLSSGNEEVDDEFILLTYNEDEGEIPTIVKNFLDNNAFLCSGVYTVDNILEHPYTFNSASSKIEEEYDLEILGKFDDDGDDEDTIEAILKSF